MQIQIYLIFIQSTGGPDKVAELTGRSGRHVRRHGRWIWEKRTNSGTDTKNIAEVLTSDGVPFISANYFSHFPSILPLVRLADILTEIALSYRW